MKMFFSEAQLAHQPKQYMVHGRIVDPFEKPDRATTLVDALETQGLVKTDPGDFGRDAILAVHAEHYVDFLEDAYDRFLKLPNHGPEVLPNVHPYRGAGIDLEERGRPRTTGILGQAGWYMGDMSCAVMAGTFQAAYASAQTAIAGAEAVLAGERASFALCRPPGHHAYADRASGFCFFNNAAIAAAVLRSHFPKVAIVDFDTHHAGYADETGAGPGEGANHNLPLSPGADDEAFIDANQRLALAVQAHGAEALVLSAGWDAHRNDPLSKLNVTSEAFARIGEIWGKIDLPTLIVQEGGYSLAAVAEAAPAFITAFRANAAE
jgi:acetoin utilization deacetylase AcuC-like enzyme